MAQEQEGDHPRIVESIQYFPQRKVVIVAVEGDLIFSLSHTPDGLVYQQLTGALVTERSVEKLMTDPDEAPRDPHASTERAPATKSPTVVIAGRLQTQPAEGRPDRQGKPTAWARFLGHIPDQEGATLLSTSFHGTAREIALGLPKDAQITAQGYLHLRDDADAQSRRLSSFSVIHLISYPGKPRTPHAGD